MASKEKLSCVFSYAGCKDEFTSDKQKEHMEQNTQKHLAMMAAATLKLTHIMRTQQEIIETKLQLQKEEFEKKLKQRDLLIQSYLQKMQLGQKIEPMLLGVVPFDIHFSNYKDVKAKNELMDSPPFFTHPGGYKVNLRVRPNGFLSGKGTHISVWFNSLKSDHDGVLKIPMKFMITIQLLNQHCDHEHVEKEVACEVTEEKAGTWRYIGAEWELIGHGDLELDTIEQTQYLKDDCIKFRICKIVIPY